MYIVPKDRKKVKSQITLSKLDFRLFFIFVTRVSIFYNLAF